ncbi:MAG: AMP-binding protein [Halioglobus sp.]|nr:AMP-binding protein [Halioglobus sp.]
MPHPHATAKYFPNRPAIVMGDSGEVVTFQQLEERSNRGAHLFRSLGLQAGDHICMMMDNNRYLLEIVWAAQRSGLIFTPINTHIEKEDIVYIVGNCNAKLFIGSIECVDSAEAILCEHNSVDHFYMVKGTRAGFRSWEADCSKQPDTRIVDESNGVPMIYSSGITGLPKGIAIAPDSDNVNTPPMLVPYLARTFEFDENTVYLSPSPLHHAAPLYFTMMTTYQGGTTVLMERFEPETALKLIERHRVSHSQFVPIMFTQMLKLPPALRESYDMCSMRTAIHGAAPCPIEIKEQMIDWWGDVLIEYYSSSEGVGMTVIDSLDWLDHKGSVGRALVGNIHIVGDDGTELPPNEVGTVYFSGKHLKFTYHREPDKTSDAYHERGWATAADIGYVDTDGFLYLADRQTFAIVSGGITIYPQELENILASHDKVADVAVIGIPSEKFGEEVKAVIEPTAWSDANTETADEILEWLSGRVSWFKMPRSLDFHPKLPRFDTGKLRAAAAPPVFSTGRLS